MFGILNEFIYGAIWLAAVIALGFTGWRAANRAHFRAVSETYYGRKAQAMGGVCLFIAVVAGIFFVQRLLAIAVFGLSASSLFFLLGAAFGGYLTYRYYARAV